MKFIYDEAEAIRKKQEIDAETPIKNRQAKIHTASLATALLLGVAAAFFGIFCWHKHCKTFPEVLSGEVSRLLLTGMRAFCDCAAIGVAIIIYLNNCKFVLSAKQRYPASVIYHITTRNKNILKSTIEKTNSTPILGDDYIVNLTLEGENHVVTEESVILAFFRTQTRTNLDEVSIDLDEETVSIPYEP